MEQEKKNQLFIILVSNIQAKKIAVRGKNLVRKTFYNT